MNKIICDICGTSYQESAECCPICGCTRETATGLMEGELLAEETVGTNTGVLPKKKEIFDFDEVNAAPNDEDEDEEDFDEEEEDEEDEEEESPRHNTFVVILLTLLIAGLLLAAGFIFIKYFLPNMRSDEPAATTAVVQETETVAVQETGVPCELLTMLNTSVAELNEEGQQFLLNIKPQPENTTDKIIYTVADESIATVSEDGKITAVSEGETNVYISCGEFNIVCPVIVKYVEETVPPTTEAEVVETVPQETTDGETTSEGAVSDETVPAETAPANTDLKNVTLKLKKTDIRLGVYYQFTLELDCDLEQNEVEWSSEHPHIAKVDENGVVTAVKSGTTVVTAKYGEQKVDCWIRCG